MPPVRTMLACSHGTRQVIALLAELLGVSSQQVVDELVGAWAQAQVREALRLRAERLQSASEPPPAP